MWGKREGREGDMRTWSNGKDFRAGKQQGEETAAQIRWQRNGGKDTATQIQRHRYSGTDTAAQKKASQPYRMSGGLRCTMLKCHEIL